MRVNKEKGMLYSVLLSQIMVTGDLLRAIVIPKGATLICFGEDGVEKVVKEPKLTCAFVHAVASNVYKIFELGHFRG